MREGGSPVYRGIGTYHFDTAAVKMRVYAPAWRITDMRTAAAFVALICGVGSVWAVEPAIKPATAVHVLMQRDLLGLSGKEVWMGTVEYIPGGASLPHRHDAQVFVFVLEGEFMMQVNNEAAVRVRRGETFYESPGDVHTLAVNTSATKPAKILVFMLKDKRAPVSAPAAPEQP
jgi:quercetin dioxygenase-like cupin family protein